MMLSQLLVHERAGNHFGLPWGKQASNLLWQMFTQEGPGEVKIAQGLLEEAIMNAGELI
jgi:hypothetical protein